MGAPLSGYYRIEHPVQQRILGCLEAMTGCNLATYPAGVDGVVPLRFLAPLATGLAD